MGWPGARARAISTTFWASEAGRVLEALLIASERERASDSLIAAAVKVGATPDISKLQFSSGRKSLRPGTLHLVDFVVLLACGRQCPFAVRSEPQRVSVARVFACSHCVCRCGDG